MKKKKKKKPQKLPSQYFEQLVELCDKIIKKHGK